MLGRNWLCKLRLNWSVIHYTTKVKAPSLEGLSKSYSVFNGKLGTVKGITASLKVKDTCQPKFFKPRPVPFALKDKIADELLRLEKGGFWKR